MVFSTLVKQAKQVTQGEKLSFFQSAYPYLNRNSLINFNHFFNARWSNEEPHPSQTFLGIDNGHFGVYFTMYNHDADKKRKQAEKIIYDENSLNWNSAYINIHFTDQSAKFIISKVNNDIFINVNNLKLIIKHFLSTSSVVCPKKVLSVDLLSKIAFKDVPKLVYVENVQPKVTELESIQPTDINTFENELLSSQSSRIRSIHEQHKDVSELRIIHPLYQSLRRNDICFPEIELYNIVLESIVKRDLNNDNVTVNEVETRLTDLMTVYQDILTSPVKPNKDTFNLILTSLFEGAIDTIKISNSKFSSQDVYELAFNKSQEYSKVGINLLMSIKDPGQLNMSFILEKLFLILNYHPELISKDLISKIMYILPKEANGINYYVGLLGLTKYFSRLGVYGSNDELYDFIVSIYKSYQAYAEGSISVGRDDGMIYACLLQTLVLNGNLPLATKFLDDILIDYKNNLTNSSRVSKEVMSNLLSVFLQSILNADPSVDGLSRVRDLMTKFNAVSYLPELSSDLYNSMIISYISHYHQLEAAKRLEKESRKRVEMETIQASYYNHAWSLYDHLAIRLDFQKNDFEISSLAFNNTNINCRDVLLSSSISLGDHERIFQLIKEIILKNHLIKDPNTSKKLHAYLLNGAYNGQFNKQYFELLWSIIESQSLHYRSSSTSLNNFMSENCVFLVPEINDYVSETLIDSRFIHDCFERFVLSEDSCYGVVSVCKALMSYSSSKKVDELSQESKLKLTKLYAYLIEQLEDTENHYLPVVEDLKTFKSTLKIEFCRLVQNSPNMSSLIKSSIVEDACKSCNVELIDEINYEKVDSTRFSMNLAYLLATNYDIGLERFLHMFQKGYLFNKDTWSIIINSSFVISLLEAGNSVSTATLVDRLMKSNISGEDKSVLLSRLIEVGSDKVNIEMIQILSSNDQLIADSDVVRSLMITSTSSQNRYLISQLIVKLDFFLSRNNDMKWLIEGLKFLEKNREHSRIVAVAKSTDYLGLDLKNPTNLSFVVVLLRAAINAKEINFFSTVVESYFSVSCEYNYLLQDSNELLNLLITYYTILGRFGTVTDRFVAVANKSKEIESSVLFAAIMSSLHSGEQTSLSLKASFGDQSPKQKAITLLVSSNAAEMYKLFEKTGFKNNISLITRHFLDYLCYAGSLNNRLDCSQKSLIVKFEAYIKLLRMLNVKSLSVDNLVQVIKFLAIIGNKDTLNIILNKMILEGEFAPMMNFYFLDINISAAKDVLALLQSLKAAFQEVNDTINIEIIDNYCSENNISI